MPAGRFACAAVVIPSTTEIMLLGGNGVVNRAQALDTVDIYDTGTNTWKASITLPTPRASFLAVYHNGHVYVVGGERGLGMALSTMDIFDTEQQIWSSGPALSRHLDHSSGQIVGDTIYVFGHEPRPEGTFEQLGFAYDVPSGTWRSIQRPPQVMMTCSAVGENIYCFAFGETWMYSTSQDHWTEKARMSASRTLMTSTAVGEQVYVIGGELGAVQPVPWVEVYDTITDTWSPLADMHTPRSWPCSTQMDDQVFVFGGFDINQSMNALATAEMLSC